MTGLALDRLMPRAVALAVRPAQGWRLAADEEATALTDKAYALGELQAIFGRAAWGYLAHLALLVHDQGVVGVTGDVLFGREVTGLSFLWLRVDYAGWKHFSEGPRFDKPLLEVGPLEMVQSAGSPPSPPG